MRLRNCLSSIHLCNTFTEMTTLGSFPFKLNNSVTSKKMKDLFICLRLGIGIEVCLAAGFTRFAHVLHICSSLKGNTRCVPFNGKFTTDNNPEFGFGGGERGSGMDPCPPTYKYLGTSCVKFPVQSPNNYAQAKQVCSLMTTRGESIYSPGDRMQNYVFRQAMMQKVRF